MTFFVSIVIFSFLYSARVLYNLTLCNLKQTQNAGSALFLGNIDVLVLLLCFSSCDKKETDTRCHIILSFINSFHKVF